MTTRVEGKRQDLFLLHRNTVILTPKIRRKKKIMNEAHSDCFKHTDVVKKHEKN